MAVPPDAKQDFAVSGNGSASAGNQSPWSPNVLSDARNAFGSLGRETVNTTHKMLWGLGKLLLSAGESVNFVWDVALNAVLSLLKTGGAAYGAVAEKVADVPIVGYGAGGVREVISATLGAAESNARHDMQVRRDAFAALAAKLEESGKRLSAGGTAPEGAVRFPDH